jgi:hypothetical protein
MNRLEKLFLAQRRRLNITDHIEALAKKDAEWFIDLYKQTIDKTTDDDESELKDDNNDNSLDDIYNLAVSLIRSFVVKKTSIPTLKKQIEDYFKSVNYIENSSVNKKCKEELMILFKNPAWKAINIYNKKDGYANTLKWIYYRFAKQIKKDENVILDIIHDIILKIQNTGRDFSEIMPAYCKTICNNDDIDKKYNSPEYNFSDLANEPDDDFEGFISAIEGLICEYPNLERLYKPEDFAKALKLLLNLNNRDTEFMEVLKEASYIYLDVKNYRDPDKKWRKIIRKLFDEAQRIWLEKGLKRENFRQTKLRLLAKIKSNPNSNMAKGELMGFMTTDHLNDDKIQLDILNHFIPYFNNMMTPNNEINLKAYRLWPKEIINMEWLRKIFNENGLMVGRYPEIYYDDFDTACKIFPSLLNMSHEEEGNPDYLGVYIYDFGTQRNEDPFLFETKEGIIILFKDRIEKHRNGEDRTPEEITLLRHVVLMHELGHWFTHISLHTAANRVEQFWNLGYHFKNKKTKEGLAQLIAYWCIEKEPEALDVLTKLTPKDINDPYACYQLLVKKSKTEILEKLKELRTAFYLKDEVMFDYLLSENKTLFDDYIDCSKPNEYFDNTKKITQEDYNNILANGGILKPGWFGITEDQYKSTQLLHKFKVFNK